MSSLHRPLDEISDAVLEAAAIWRQRVEAPAWNAGDAAGLEAWLAADERHARAYARTVQLWDFLDDHAAAPEMLAARRELLGRVHRMTRERAGGGWLRRASGRRTAAAAAAVLLLTIGAWPLSQRGDIYQTGRGERRVVTLADGSKLSLDAQTRVRVRYAKNARRLTLVQGQARFDVARDLARPFSVRAGDRTVVATGTAFNIDLLDPTVTITLIEGRVLVYGQQASPIGAAPPILAGLKRQLAAAPRPVELRPGDQLISAERADGRVIGAVDLREATAWQGGKLMFDDEPLSDAVARVNRYTERKITIADPAAGAIRISGVFDAGDSNAFLEAVTGFLPVVATEGTDGVSLQSVRRN